jgi:hypothetical protein
MSSEKKYKLFYVLAGGISDDLSLPIWVKERCNLAIKSYSKGDLIICSSCFSMNKLPKILNNKVISESSMMQSYIENKIDVDINCENLSHDTFMSIFLLYEIYAQIYSNRQLIVITSNFHKAKTQFLIDNIGAFYNRAVKLAISNDCIDEKILKERILHENKQLKKLESVFKNIKTIKSLKKHLFTKHSNYNSSFSSKTKTRALY